MGTLILARSGEMMSVRYMSLGGPERQELFTREGGGPEIFCLNSDRGWYCEEGAGSTGAPVFVSPDSLERFASQVATVPADMMRISTRELAGLSATCFDVGPEPDRRWEPADTFTDLLELGGSVCFGNNKLLRIAVLGDPPLTFDATEVRSATDDDFKPPATPVRVKPPEPVTTVIQAS